PTGRARRLRRSDSEPGARLTGCCHTRLRSSAAMTKTITTEQLAALAAAVDAGAEQRGWNEGHVLVRVEADSGSEEGCQLGTRDLEGHPLESLLGFTAPDEWLALGVCCEGWGASLDSPRRPSQSKGRMRVRTTVLVSRDGAVASGLRV